MSMSRPEQPIAHVYAPRFPQDPIEIIGSRRGLERLINVLIDAVSVGSSRGEVCTSDDTASLVRVTCLEGRRRPEEWLRSGSPHWEVADPFVARILDLSEENGRLREMVAMLRLERRSVVNLESLGGSTGRDGGTPAPG